MEYGPPPLFRQGMSVRIRFLLSVLAAIILILVDGRLRAVDGFRSALVSFTTPLVEVVAAPARFIGEYENYFTSKRTLSDENQRLKEENQLLLLRAARLNELEVENARLRSLVEAVPRTTSHTKTAEVLGRVSDPFVSRLQINLGERDGLVTGMPVIGVYGVLGQVNRTVHHVRVGEQRNACHVRNKQYREEPLQDRQVQSFHLSLFSAKIRGIIISDNPH